MIIKQKESNTFVFIELCYEYQLKTSYNNLQEARMRQRANQVV